VIEQLNEAAKDLQNEVSCFKVNWRCHNEWWCWLNKYKIIYNYKKFILLFGCLRTIIVSSIGINIDEFEEKILSIKLWDSGYAYVKDAQGNGQIYHVSIE
jgi:hypothetical protein